MSHIKSKANREHDVLSEIVKNGLKRKNDLSGDETRMKDEEIYFNMSNRNPADEKLFKEGLNNILKSILASPRTIDDSKNWDFTKKGSSVRPMIRFPDRSSKSSNTDLDKMVEDILRRIEKSMEKDPQLGEKKFDRWRIGHKTAPTTTDSYERRRLKDFFMILRQLSDMGISIKQMDQISKEPIKYKRIGDSMDERQKVSMLEKLIDECNEIQNDAKNVDYQDPEIEEVVKILGEKSGSDQKRDLVKLLYALNSFVY